MVETYIKNPSVLIKEEESSGALLYNVDTDQIWLLNSTAYFIWNLCDGKNTFNSISNSVKSSFAISSDTKVDQDIRKLIDYMLETSFIGTYANDSTHTK